MLVVEKLKQLVASERRITAEIIAHIQEIDQKKIFAQLGYPSLFAFLTEYIGYAAASAQRRIEAARLLSVVPEVKNEIKSGALNLSQVALVAQAVRQKIKEMPEVKIEAEDKKVLLQSIKNQNLQASQKIISQTLDLEIKALDRKIVQKDESVRMEITFSKDQMDLFNKVKGLISHVNPSATMAEVFDYLAKDYLKRKDPMQGGTKYRGKIKTVSVTEVKSSSKYKFISGSEVHNSAKSNTVSVAEVKNEPSVKNHPGSSRRKRIPLGIRRIVWKRDEGKCQHKNNTTGKICGSNYLLEFDHIKRFRNGGDDSLQNLRLLCKAHNLWRG